MEGGPGNTLSTTSSYLPVYYSSALLYLIETTVQTFFLFSFQSLFLPLPPRYHLSPPPLWGTDRRYVLKCRVSSYLPPIGAWRQWAVHLRPHCSLQTCGKETQTHTMQLSWYTKRGFFLLLIASVTYCPPLLSFCSVFPLSTCLMFTNCCHLPTSL